MRAAGARVRTRAVQLWSEPAIRLVTIAVVLCAAIAGFLTAYFVSPSGARPTMLEHPITIKRELATTAALFGDPLEAEVDVYTDDREIEPGSVHVQSDLTPYRAVATRVDRSSHGGVSLQRTRIVLACLTQACLAPRGTDRWFGFRPLTVTYSTGGRVVRAEVLWDQIQVSSRLPAEPAARVRVVDTAPPLDPGFWLSPTLLRALLILLAAILGLAGAALVVRGLWPRFFLSLNRWQRLSPLERSLRQVETVAQTGDETERRHVLDELATRLAELPSPSLEARTRSLAWGASTPDPEALAVIAAEVRTSVNGGSRR